MNRLFAGWIVAATAGAALAGCHADGSPDHVPANSVDSPENPAGTGTPSSPSRSEPGSRAFKADAESSYERLQGAAATRVTEPLVSSTGLPMAADPSESREPAAAAPETALTSPPARFEFERPEHIRGLYLNAWSAGSRRRLAALIDIARRTEINAFVIDIKDATGFVSHPTDVPLAREVGATGEVRIPDLGWTLRQLDSAGIYPIARIVIVKDPLLARAKPDLAIQDTAGGPWRDNNGTVWLNPYRREVWDYHVDLAREVAAMGIGEIQWDYVRFPDAPASALGRAHFPGRNGQPKDQAIREFLAYSRNALAPMGVDVTADVFGVTTSATGDVGIGQVWESFIDVVDVALPMVYPSHYWTGAFGIEHPNAHPYEVVRRALEDAVRRSSVIEAAGDTRPWLQDFTLGKPKYGAAEVRAQIQAAYDVGIREWVLWNPGSRYTEDALEPAVGFVEDPLVRIAGQVLPASRRFDVFDTASAEEVPDSADAPAVEKDSATIPPRSLRGRKRHREEPRILGSRTTGIQGPQAPGPWKSAPSATKTPINRCVLTVWRTKFRCPGTFTRRSPHATGSPCVISLSTAHAPRSLGACAVEKDIANKHEFPEVGSPGFGAQKPQDLGNRPRLPPRRHSIAAS